MSHVTPETALRLEAAGFPKPEMQFGQFWYFPGKKKEVVITGLHDDGDGRLDNLKYIAFSWQGTDSDLQKEAFFKHFMFLPTATDILKEFKVPVFSHWFEFVGTRFQIQVFVNGGMEHQFFHENPAECAAMAWLQIHEKK